MADYHPLDTRYKGPSTAYRGSTKKTAFEKEDIFKKPSNPSLDSKAKTPPPLPLHKTAAQAGPWGNTNPPPLPKPDEIPHHAPPPLPTRQHRQNRPRRSGGRFAMWLAIIVLVVSVSQYLDRTTGFMTLDIQDILDDAERGSSRSVQGQTL